jgi:hypothetical protein
VLLAVGVTLTAVATTRTTPFPRKGSSLPALIAAGVAFRTELDALAGDSGVIVRVGNPPTREWVTVTDLEEAPVEAPKAAAASATCFQLPGLEALLPAWRSPGE